MFVCSQNPVLQIHILSSVLKGLPGELIGTSVIKTEFIILPLNQPHRSWEWKDSKFGFKTLSN